MTARAKRRLLAPEVVQTSSMDCGPAALKCLLEGHGVPVSYGRLREACQTDVDGTSIDTLEVVAGQLGLQAEQVMVPIDHLLRFGADALPAIVVMRQGDGGTHFVVVWRRVGRWLQVMDPAHGRRWTRIDRFEQDVFRHRLSVPSADWREWALSDEFRLPLQARMRALGADDATAMRLVTEAQAYPGWFGLGALDAATRLVLGLVHAGGLERGAAAARLLEGLVRDTVNHPDDIYTLIPPDHWSVAPDPEPDDPTRQHLLLHGAVSLRFAARPPAPADAIDVNTPLSRELQATLDEPTPRPLAALWTMLRADGLLSPLLLAAAALLATGALVVEALLFKGLIDAAAPLQPGLQRLGAAAAVIAFLLLLFAVELPIVRETLRLGRHLDARLRLALLDKLPRLSDRYFQSRPVSDMAERGHAIVATRAVPALGLQVVQTLGDLVFTLLGIALLDMASVPWAAGIAACAVILPLVLQPLLSERDLRVRTQAAALAGFHLDALLGLVPIRTHRAAPAVRRQHEGLLVAWVKSSRGLIRLSLATSGLQSLLGIGLTAGLVWMHFSRVGGVSGGDLLLVYWALKLPRIGQHLAGLAQRYPAQRNVLLRLAEPLAAPEAPAPAPAPSVDGRAAKAGAAPQASGVSIRIEQASVLAAGHTVLQHIDLVVAPGEQIAIVGPSGAGKSSLLGVLLGWHRLSEGNIRVDDQTLDEADLPALRRQTAWVDPAVQLWNRSLLDNLVYACSDDALDRLSGALDAARLRGLLQHLPQGLQTPLGEGGARVSGGEGQRVRLARALMQTDARLVLLDEPFRGLDRAQRSALLAEARAWWRDATLLCVTHDVSETLGFDRVLVIEDGRITEDDAPAALAARPSRYRDLLDAETRVRDGLWHGTDWRRLRLADGRLEEAR